MGLVYFEFAGEARAALHAIASDPAYGTAALSSSQTLANLLRDYLPDAPRETGLLIAAASAGVADLIRDHVAHGLDARTAVSLAASSLEGTSAFVPEACQWVTVEMAIALGLPGADQLGDIGGGALHYGTPSAAGTPAGQDAVTQGPGPGQAGQPFDGAATVSGAWPGTPAAAAAGPAGPAGPAAWMPFQGPADAATAAAHGSQREMVWTGQVPVPAAPAPRSDERWTATPFPLADSSGYTLGWQYSPPGKGGPAFLTLRRNALGSLRVVERYPLTDEGWSAAWRALVSLDPNSANQVLAVLASRAAADSTRDARRKLNSRSRVHLPDAILLAGYVPDAYLPTGRPYDIRLLEDRLAVYARNGVRALAELPFSDITGIDVIDPRRPQAGVFRGLNPAPDEAELAGILAAAAMRGRFKAVVRIRAARTELFFGSANSDPDRLRGKVSAALTSGRLVGQLGQQTAGAQEPARAQHPVPGEPDPGQAAPAVATELARLASLLERGLLTREEYELLKARLIPGT